MHPASTCLCGVCVMSRRVESQLHRDWNFGYASWNLLFRATINMSRTLYSYEGRANDEGSSMTAQELEESAIQLCSALPCHYTDASGKSKPVKGVMTKLRWVSGLCRAAKRAAHCKYTPSSVHTSQPEIQNEFDQCADCCCCCCCCCCWEVR